MFGKFCVLLSSLWLLGSCNFEEDVLFNGPEPDTRLSIIDTSRNTQMTFDVFDSTNQFQLIGYEYWTYQGVETRKGRSYVHYWVNRDYQYDRSGGSFYILLADNHVYDIWNVEANLPMRFMQATNDWYFPADSMSSYTLEWPTKKITTRWYRGVELIPTTGKSEYCFRGGRDSTANNPASFPYFAKYEDYYFSRFGSLRQQIEKRVKTTAQGDSIEYVLVKRRSQ
ncbi:MAG: hypothetical protein EP332_10925 [Bacteroidetes bacterium]|nr:MAG: hypothetical protein EP332_10925 [Bacteroidota bacterium]